MPNAETPDQLQPKEASSASTGLLMNFPELPNGAAMQRPIIGRYDLWLMQPQAHREGPQMHLMPGHYIRGPQMRGGLMREHFHFMGEPHVMRGGLMREHINLMGEPQGPLINVQGGRGIGPPRGIQRRGMGPQGMGPRGMKPPGMLPRHMAPPQDIEPQRRREPERKKPRSNKNQGVEPREMGRNILLGILMEPLRGTKRSNKTSQGIEPQAKAPKSMEPPNGTSGSKASNKSTRGKKI